MQWLFIVYPARADMLTSGPTEFESEVVGRHFMYWKRLTKEGTALVVGRTQTTGPDTMGLTIFRAPDEAAARALAEADPAVVEGVFTMRLEPYFVALLGDPAPFKPA